MESRVYNFSPGPAMLPEPVLVQAQKELLNWNGLGMSVMEISHRSAEFASIVEQTQADLKELLSIPDNYRLLFMHGGAQSQFSMIPMNLQQPGCIPVYAQTGHWGTLAKREAERFGPLHVALDTASQHYQSIPDVSNWDMPDNPAYLYYCDNESIHGVEFDRVPAIGDIPLVCDMTANLMSKVIPIDQFGMIFASAQKNLGIAGITLVIIREDLLLRQPMERTPQLYQYQQINDKRSLGNTPATFSWYMTGLVLQWIKQQGGLSVIEALANQKAQLLYDCIDQHPCYVNNIDARFRSNMNVVFQLQDAALNDEFLMQAHGAGLVNLKGHRNVGGMRASLYNAMPLSGVRALVDFMIDFSHKHV